jgi:hypothetical protein
MPMLIRWRSRCVLNSPRNVAESAVRERDLVPKFNTLSEQAGAPML